MLPPIDLVLVNARSLLAALLCTALVAPLGAQQPDSIRRPAPTGKFVGEIRSISTTYPVDGADIRLMFIDSVQAVRERGSKGMDELFVDSTKSRVGITDAQGAFTIRGVRPGHYMVSVRRIGFEPFEGLLTLDTATVEMQLALTQVAAVLPPIRVSASSTNRVTEQLDRVGFTSRYRSGTSGSFLDRAEILRRRPVHLTDILESYGIHEDASVTIDRMPADWELLRDYPPDLVVGIEIYRRQGALPTEYNMTKNAPGIMSPGGQQAMMAPTVLIWTFIP